MTAIITAVEETEVIYPSGDGKTVAESYDHLYAILTTFEVLKQYLTGRQATVLATQYLYYSQALPRLRLKPDVMVIFDVDPGGRDSYKIWEEKQVPTVIFDITSPLTEEIDRGFNKKICQQLEVQEYWLFDPKGECIKEKLEGYRLQGETYESIADNRSLALQLRLAVEGKLIGFYREDTGEKLLLPTELAEALQQTTLELQQALQRAEQERQRAEEMESLLARYRQQFGELPDDAGTVE